MVNFIITSVNELKIFFFNKNLFGTDITKVIIYSTYVLNQALIFFQLINVIFIQTLEACVEMEGEDSEIGSPVSVHEEMTRREKASRRYIGTAVSDHYLVGIVERTSHRSPAVIHSLYPLRDWIDNTALLLMKRGRYEFNVGNRKAQNKLTCL